jgi:WD40 repeat protein
VRLLSLSLLTLLLISLSSCSSKTDYRPKKEEIVNGRLPFIFNKVTIDRVEHDRVILSNGCVFDRFGNELNISEESKRGFVSSENGNLIASVNEDNSVELFDKSSNKTIFKEKFNRVSTIDRRLPKPLFDKDNILYFTLDGKIVIYSTKFRKIQRVISVSFDSDYGNVIDYRLTANSITLLTHREILQITEDSDKKISLPLRGAIFHDDHFFAIAKNGEVRKYNYQLELLDSIKFQFAYFVAFGEVDGRIYLIESNGWLIDLDRDFKDYRVFEENVDLDYENCFFTPQRFLCDNKFFRLPLPR